MKKVTLVLLMMLALIGLNANAAIYIVGDGPLGGWAPNGGIEMTSDGNGLYTYTMTIPENASSAAVYFVFADNRAGEGDWGTFNSQYRIGPTGGNVDVTVGEWMVTQKAGGDNGAYKLLGVKGESYTVTYDENNSQFKVEGYVVPISEDTYTVAGTSNLFGSNWDENDTNNDMTLVNGLYTWSKNDVELQGSFEFKVVANHDWGISYPASNYHQALDAHGIYDVTITFDANSKNVTCVANMTEEIIDTTVVATTYTVAGVTELVGSYWDPTDVNNDMTLVDGLYTLVKENVALNAGSYGFKVVKDHSWDNGSWPENNWILNIEQNGNYNITFTFNEETTAITCEYELVEEIEDFYTVAGEPAAIFGEEWNEGYAANNLALDEETGLYTWTKNDVEMTAGQIIEFKIVKNANWNTCWPESNWHYECPEDGTYNLVITFNAETEEVTFEATKQGGEEPPVEMVYTVVGDAAVFGSNWDETDTNNDMTGEEGVYTWSKENVELAAGSFGFKVVGNHSWDNEWPTGYGNNWIAYVDEAGIYTVTITYEPEAADSLKITCTLLKTGDIEPVHYEGDVYILGEVNDNGGWFTNKGVLMTRDAEKNLYTATITTAGENIPEGEETGYSYFSFTKQLAETEADWEFIAPYRFGAVSEGDFWVTDEVLGTEIQLQNGGQSFRVPAGEWNLTLSVDNMTLVIEKTFIVGDVNGDNEIDINDVTLLIDAVLSGDFSTINSLAGDCNNDNDIDINDITLLIDRVLNGVW